MKGSLVRATLEGRKTQTRRPIKPQPDDDIVDVEYDAIADLWLGNTQEDNDLGYTSSWAMRCPLGQAGDRLWVRETFAIVHPCRDCEAGYVDDIKQPSVIPKDNAGGYWVPWYRSDWKGDDDTERGFQWTPSIHMPRWASRIVLPLMSIRVERVQDITEEDAKAEGVEPIGGSYREGFREVWQSIYGTWDANPWVWVAEWKEIEVSK